MSPTPDSYPCSLREVDTPVGPARAWTQGPRDARATVVLGHGAGGGVEAVDLLAARDAALAAGLAVVRVEQPWRVSGRRVAEAPPRLDAAWLAVVGTLAGPLVVGGRSAGARVACRTAGDVGAVAVLALAFPLRTRTASRLDELRRPGLVGRGLPRLVVQGERDAFGVPEPEAGVEVHVVAGADHGFAVRRIDGRRPQDVRAQVQAAVGRWLAQVLAPLDEA